VLRNIASKKKLLHHKEKSVRSAADNKFLFMERVIKRLLSGTASLALID
jgi:hypothetical protein